MTDRIAEIEKRATELREKLLVIISWKHTRFGDEQDAARKAIKLVGDLLQALAASEARVKELESENSIRLDYAERHDKAIRAAKKGGIMHSTKHNPARPKCGGVTGRFSQELTWEAVQAGVSVLNRFFSDALRLAADEEIVEEMWTAMERAQPRCASEPQHRRISGSVMPKDSGSKLPAREVAKRETSVLTHMLTTPHKPHKPLGKTVQAKRRKKEKRAK